MPVANEGDTMRQLLKKIMALKIENLFVFPVVDFFSKDDTEKIIDQEEKLSGGRVHKIFYEKSTGMVSCYFEGFRQALDFGAERIIEMDGGQSHLPEEIPLFIEKLDEGYDCVFGSRFLKGGKIQNHPLYRRAISFGGTFLSNFFLHTKLCDMTSGFEAFSKKVLQKFNFENFLSHGHFYQTEMRFYCRNFKIAEVPIHYAGGSSSLKIKSVLEAFRLLFKIKKNEERAFKKEEK